MIVELCLHAVCLLNIFFFLHFFLFQDFLCVDDNHPEKHLFIPYPEPRFHHLCYSNTETQLYLFSSIPLQTCRNSGLPWRNPNSTFRSSRILCYSTVWKLSTKLCTFHFNMTRFLTRFQTLPWAEITCCAQWHSCYFRGVTWCLCYCQVAMITLTCYFLHF